MNTFTHYTRRAHPAGGHLHPGKKTGIACADGFVSVANPRAQRPCTMMTNLRRRGHCTQEYLAGTTHSVVPRSLVRSFSKFSFSPSQSRCSVTHERRSSLLFVFFLSLSSQVKFFYPGFSSFLSIVAIYYHRRRRRHYHHDHQRPLQR